MSTAVHNNLRGGKVELLTQRRIVAEIVKLAQTLPPSQRIMIWMRFRDGYTLKDIATAFQCHEGTARRRLISIGKELLELKKKQEILIHA